MALRQQYDKPIFDDLEIWLKEQLDKISGKTPLAKAIRYALARMPKARAYLDNGFLGSGLITRIGQWPRERLQT